MYVLIEVVRKCPDILEDVRSKLRKPMHAGADTVANVSSGIKTWLSGIFCYNYSQASLG